MSQSYIDLSLLEELRDAGDYDKLGTMIPPDWSSLPEFDEEAIGIRILASEISARGARLDEMEAALAPYLEDVNKVPFGVAPRVLLAAGAFYYRRGEAAEGLRLASLAKTIAAAREDELIRGEAVQLEGQIYWALEKWSEAAAAFEVAISIYSSQARAYRLGISYLCLGSVLNRMGKVEEARTTLERAIKILLKSQDEYSLAVARVNVAIVLNTVGEHEMALKYLQFAEEKFEQMGHQQYTYVTLNTIGATLVWLKEYDRADTCISRALEVGIKARSTEIASSYEVRARMHMARREWAKAEKMLSTAVEIADQANSHTQRAEVRRTLGRLYLAQEREEDAANTLWSALDLAQDLDASLLELELKALLAQAICVSNPVGACKLLAEIEATLGARQLPELRREIQAARRRINSLDQEHFFILSDIKIPLLAEAKISLLKWLWARALHKARGNAREAASILGVTPTYIRKLTKVIPRDLLRPGRKRSRRVKS